MIIFSLDFGAIRLIITNIVTACLIMQVLETQYFDFFSD